LIMKKTSFIIVAIISFLYTACKEKPDPNFFEGYIDYKTEYKSLMPHVTDEQIKTEFGKSLRIYYKDGNTKWVFTGDKGELRSYQMSHQKINTEYTWNESAPDTIYSYDKAKEGSTHIDNYIDAGQDTVLDCICQVVKLIGTSFHGSPNGPVPSSFFYSFCPELRLNPDHYKYTKEFKWDELTKKYKSIAIKMISKFEHYVIGTFTAVKIKSTPVNMSEFTLDKSKIIKPMSE